MPRQILLFRLSRAAPRSGRVLAGVDVKPHVFPMIDVEELPAYAYTVSRWRAGRGSEVMTGITRRSARSRRLAWSASEAADLSGVALRTCHAWRSNKLVEPSVYLPDDGVVDRRYCSADVLGLVVVRDLLNAGIPRAAVQSVADNLAESFAFGALADDIHASFSTPLEVFDRMLVPSTAEASALLRSQWHEGFIPLSDDDVEDEGSPLQDKKIAKAMREYPIARRCEELAGRAAQWWTRVGMPTDMRPPWLT